MPQRRRRARGHIRELPSGSFQVIVYAGKDPLTGKERYERQTAKTYQAAEIVLTKLQARVDGISRSAAPGGKSTQTGSAGRSPSAGTAAPSITCIAATVPPTGRLSAAWPWTARPAQCDPRRHRRLIGQVRVMCGGWWRTGSRAGKVVAAGRLGAAGRDVLPEQPDEASTRVAVRDQDRGHASDHRPPRLAAAIGPARAATSRRTARVDFTAAPSASWPTWAYPAREDRSRS
jgi:hypothetical protein